MDPEKELVENSFRVKPNVYLKRQALLDSRRKTPTPSLSHLRSPIDYK
jgi:hypothetical protein